MKTVITFEEDDNKLNIDLHYYGNYFTNKEKRLLNSFFKLIPKSAKTNVTGECDEGIPEGKIPVGVKGEVVVEKRRVCKEISYKVNRVKEQ